MRHGVFSKRKFISYFLQFVGGFAVGHFIFIVYDATNNNAVQNNLKHVSTKDHLLNLSSRNYNDEVLNSTKTKRRRKLPFNAKDGQYGHEHDQNGRPLEDDTAFKAKFVNNVKDALLFVGILTTNKFLKSRACVIYNTWAKHIQVITANNENGKHIKLPYIYCF